MLNIKGEADLQPAKRRLRVSGWLMKSAKRSISSLTSKLMRLRVQRPSVAFSGNGSQPTDTCRSDIAVAELA